MRYTALKVTDAGVVLFEGHARRLAPEGGAALSRFREFALGAAPGFYVLRESGDELRAQPRGPSALFDGMPARLAVSPVAGAPGPFAKPESPGTYASERVAGVATLLLSADRAEILESCSAAVVGWDGERLVLAPADRPRVDSTAEAAVAAALPHARAPIDAAGDMPIALVNAVKGPCCVECPGRQAFPQEVARALERALLATARRA
jgi:hypothetical protein